MTRSTRAAVGRRIVAVGRMLNRSCLFDGKYYRDAAAAKAMSDCEAAFDEGDLDRAARLAEVVAFMVRRQSAQHAADPASWTARHEGIEA